jgi:ArsR family transcriptional regulator, arsenate/arsenite/antimonite-responsive transcriptional repressor
MDANDAVAALAGLKHDARLAIYRGLLRSGDAGMTPGALARELGMAPSTLSFHLKELSHCALITSTQEGRSITYCANRACMASLIDFLSQHCCQLPDQNA